MSRTIAKSINVKADGSRVYAAVSSESGFRSWWTKGAKVEPRVGGNAEFWFNGNKHLMKFRFTMLENNSLVKLVNIETQNNSDWDHTELSFEILSQVNSETTIEFRHSGWENAAKTFEVCNEMWGYFLESLKTYVETGSGNPVENKADELQDPDDVN